MMCEQRGVLESRVKRQEYTLNRSSVRKVTEKYLASQLKEPSRVNLWFLRIVNSLELELLKAPI